jgi:hypothetical protein
MVSHPRGFANCVGYCDPARAPSTAAISGLASDENSGSHAPNATPEGGQVRDSPAECIGTRKTRIEGGPDPKHVSAFYAERQNLTMRMQMRRFTRLTNAFSKRFENHMHMVALYPIWYNHLKQHKGLKGLSPAMAAGISDTLWSITNLAVMVDAAALKPGKRDSYKKGNI